jgi:hypothetical protein
MNPETSSTRPPAPYDDPVRLAVLQQFFLATLSVLLLDGGVTAKACGYAILAFWAGVGVIWLRRGARPNRTDLLYIRWGSFPAWGIAFVCAAVKMAMVN